jgi:hypothetical protein
MHRSGTSVLSSVLADLGLDLGRGEVLGSNRSNPRGHFEPVGMIQRNDDALRLLGGSWSAPPSRGATGRVDLPVRWKVESAIWARSVYPRGRRAYVVKEPRLTLLLDAWRGTLPRPLVTVGVVRDPWTVAHSLTVRNGFPHEVGLALWWVYNHALVTARPQPLTIVSYEALVSDAEKVVAHLVKALAAAGLAGHLGPVDAALARVERPSTPSGASRVDPSNERVAEARQSYESMVYQPLSELAMHLSVPAWADELLAERRMMVPAPRHRRVDTPRVVAWRLRQKLRRS